MTRRTLAIVSCASALAIAGCGGGSSSTRSGETVTLQSTATTGQQSTEPAINRGKPAVSVPKGPPPKQLVVKDLIRGTGPAAKPGDQVTVQYVGVDYKSRKQFDASWDRGQPFPFQLGAAQVIPGWDRGVVGMRVGGRRELIVPPNLAYGPHGQPPVIGPNATLVFVIDLLGAHR